MVICSGFTQWKWWFSIAMLVYQRVSINVHYDTRDDDLYPFMVTIMVFLGISIEKTRCRPWVPSAQCAGSKATSRRRHETVVIHCVPWKIALFMGKICKMAIEIVDLAIKNGDFP